MVVAGYLVSLGRLFKFIIGIMRSVFARKQLVVGALVVAEFEYNSATFGVAAVAVVRGETADTTCFWQSSSM